MSEDLAARLAALSPAKRALLEQMLGRPGPPVLARGQRDPGGEPVTFAQERIFRAQRADPGSAVANVGGAIRLSGALDRAALSRAVEGLVARHEALRTSFTEREGRVLQVVAPALAAPTPLVDLSGEPDPAGAAVLRLRAAMALPFDPGQAPLLRTTLLALGPEDHVLLFVAHHAVFDGWSGGVFFGELAERYGAACQGREPRLAPLPVQPADLARWQREWIRSSECGEAVEWLRRALAGAPERLALGGPGPAPQPAPRASAVARRSIKIGQPALDAFRALCAREGASLFMGLLAAHAAALARLGGQDVVVVGTPVAARTRVELEGLVGMLANTVPIPVPVGGCRGFRELLGRVVPAATAATARQEVPFEHLVEALGRRAPGHAPIYQTMIALQNTPGGGALHGLSAAALRDPEAPPLPRILEFYSPPAARLDVTLTTVERPDGLHGLLETDPGAVPAGQAEALAAGFTERVARAAAGEDGLA